ncbi:FG-GAP-like repeat-containing protein [Luteolibacter arcticus]|uniref:FG-GAP-like repeat-containing protein n=1 Tax=Luteolibacter arcticus TaxID=1581411 RepID=A0ABT3GPZ3_9BACT|nr:FG-GAP-like repeat-containing protein [Luteolibacter arcticus]MCW1925606.1 FG-GAP-like repeat-containing protein [Luteolibacter arcticus]
MPGSLRAQTPEYTNLGSLYGIQMAPATTANLHLDVADIDGDGLDEVVRTGFPRGNASTHALVSRGGIHLTVDAYPIAGFGIPRFGDVNKDGKLDIVVAQTGTSQLSPSLEVLLGNSNGTFQAATSVPITYTAREMDLVDVDQDGKLDVVMIGYPGSPQLTSAVVFPGNGNGTFGSPVAYSTSVRSFAPMARSMAVGDINGDTWPDLAVVNQVNLGEVGILLNAGDGTFSEPTLATSYVATASLQMFVRLADLNHDGKLDLITALGDEPGVGSSFPGHLIGVRLGNGDGTFGAYTAYNVAAGADYLGSNNARIDIADMNADGHLDVLLPALPISGAFSPIFAVLLGNGDGTLRVGLRVTTPGINFINTATLRVNEDAAPDVVVSSNSASIEFYRASIPQVPVTFSTTELTLRADAAAVNLASASGAAPAGGTFSGPGVSAGIFTPATAGIGVHTITYQSPASPTGNTSSGTLTITVTELPGLTVTTSSDTSTSTDGITSLREALAYSRSLPGAQTITFSPTLAGSTITLSQGWNDSSDTAALRIFDTVTLLGPTTAPGITLDIANDSGRRHFLVEGSGSLTISHLTLRGGSVEDSGGSIWSFGSLVVRSCTFTGNSAYEGGAVQAWGGSPLLEIENSTFHGNTGTGLASAISAGAVATSLRHLTVTGNTSPGGILWIWETPVTLVNCLLTGNSDNAIRTFGGNGTGTISAGSSNNLFGATSATGVVHGTNGNLLGVTSAQVLLGILGNNGGPTATIALQPGSLAINRGGVIAGLAGDQRGSTRESGPAPDIGAYEFSFPGELAYWRMIHGLASDGSQDLSEPAGDGVENLLKYAFNLASQAGDLATPNRTILPEGGTAGLPRIEVDDQGRLVIEFVRRRASVAPGIQYEVITAENLSDVNALDLAGAMITSIDATWERVRVVDPVVTPRRFGRVQVTGEP